MPLNSIKILPSNEIDKTKWDACVRRNENGMIYSLSFYLDAMTNNWDGLIVDDYRAVMALPWKKKWGIKYFCRETFVQQLGVIGNLNNSELRTVIEFAQQKSKWYGIFAFNFLNDVAFLKGTTKQINYILELNKNYSEIFNNFSPSLRQNIRKAKKNNLRIVESTIDEAINESQKQRSPLDRKDIDIAHTRLKKFAYKFPEFIFTKRAISYDGELLATTLWLKDDRRIYNIMPATLPAGKALQAMPFLFDNVISEYCEQNLLLDFEGSNFPGVKKFYEKFSPINQPYFLYQYNRLPRIVRLLKK